MFKKECFVKRCVPALLNSYTYFLSENHNIYLSCGLSPEIFTPEVQFYNDGQYVNLPYDVWINLFNNIGKITDYFKTNKRITKNINFSENEFYKIMMTRRNKENCLKISREINVILNKIDWLRFISIAQFINSVMYYNYSIVFDVQNYYNMYLQNCLNKSTTTLSASDFYLPAQVSNNHFNYARLFYEIPYICYKKLQSDIKKSQAITEMIF